MSKRAAIEMSMTTFVTIVLVVIVMVLGIFFIQKIFQSGSNAIDSIDSQVQNEINKLFADEGGRLAIYPSSRQLTIKRGDDPKGFAFSVRNDLNLEKPFTYEIKSTDVKNCGDNMITGTAQLYLLTEKGSFTLGSSASNDLPRLVLFKIPKSAPACTMVYYLEIKRDGVSYSNAEIFVTTK